MHNVGMLDSRVLIYCGCTYAAVVVEIEGVGPSQSDSKRRPAYINYKVSLGL